MSRDEAARPDPVDVVRGGATDDDLRALHRALARRRVGERLALWRFRRQAALERETESGRDR